MNPKLFIAVFTVLLLVLCCSEAFKTSGRSWYYSRVTKPCREDRCCPNDGCEATFYNGGLWETNKEMAPTATNCRTACGKHYGKCISDCKCLFDINELRSNDCKCTLEIQSISSARARCFNHCSTAWNRCVNNCEGDGDCMLAKTQTRFSITLQGKCPHQYPCCEERCAPKFVIKQMCENQGDCQDCKVKV